MKGRCKVLSPARQSLDLLSTHFEEMGRYRLLSHEEVVELMKRIEKGDEQARELLINSNLRLVVHWARRYSRQGMEFADVIQEGYFGLIHAITKYDWRRGFTFSTYASHWIRQRIRRGLADKSRAIRLPVHMYEKVKKINRVSQELSQGLHRDPTEDELNEALNLSEGELASIEAARLAHTISLQTPVGDGDALLQDFLADRNSPSVEESAIEVRHRAEVRKAIARAFTRLSERERKIIVWRFGLNGNIPLTLDQVAEMIGLTRERIRQIEVEALRKLRNAPSVLVFEPPQVGSSAPGRSTSLKTKAEIRARETGYFTAWDAVRELGIPVQSPEQYIYRLRRDHRLEPKELVEGKIALYDIEDVRKAAAEKRAKMDRPRSLPVKVRMMTEEEISAARRELEQRERAAEAKNIHRRVETACHEHGLVTFEMAALSFGISTESMKYRIRYYRKLGRIEPAKRIGQVPLFRLDDINDAFGRRYERYEEGGETTVKERLYKRSEIADALGWDTPSVSAAVQRIAYLEQNWGLVPKGQDGRANLYSLEDVRAAMARKTDGRQERIPDPYVLKPQIQSEVTRESLPDAEPVKSLVLHDLVDKGPLPDLQVLISENGEAPYAKVVEYTLAILRRSPTIAAIPDPKTQKNIILELAGLK